MNPDHFRNSPSGTCINTFQGYCAFLPHPLPPRLEYDDKLIYLLAEATKLLGELSGTGRLLPNPHLLINPYIKREAVSSSRIEGTQASLNELFFFEAAETEEPEIPDVKEIANYVRALEFGLDLQKQLPVSVRMIKKIHTVLLEGARGRQSVPGELRSKQVWIGPKGCSLDEATYVPPPVEEMNAALTEWEKYYHSAPAETPLIQCALMHYQFEAIHPFEDGNGRMGRLLITFMLCEKGYLSQPLLYLSRFFEKNRDEYLLRLLQISQSGNWRGWIDFFLRGVVSQAQDAISDAKEILTLNQDYHKKLRETKHIPQTAPQLIDELFSVPVISIPRLTKKWDLSFQAVQRGVNRLMEMGILRKVTDRKRNRLFVASDIFDFLTRSH